MNKIFNFDREISMMYCPHATLFRFSALATGVEKKKEKKMQIHEAGYSNAFHTYTYMYRYVYLYWRNIFRNQWSVDLQLIHATSHQQNNNNNSKHK